METALKDPWVEKQIYISTETFWANYQKHQKGTLPQLMIGNNLSAGVIDNVSELLKVIRSGLNLK